MASDATELPRRVYVLSSSTRSRRLSLTTTDGHNFLIDTGSEVSVKPPSPAERKAPVIHNNITLYAANNTRIATYGCKPVRLTLSNGATMVWNFIIADVKHRIIGADLLDHHRLMVDIHNKQLISPQNPLWNQIHRNCCNPSRVSQTNHRPTGQTTAQSTHRFDKDQAVLRQSQTRCRT